MFVPNPRLIHGGALPIQKKRGQSVIEFRPKLNLTFQFQVSTEEWKLCFWTQRSAAEPSSIFVHKFNLNDFY